MSILDKLLGELDEEPEKARRLARRLAADIALEEHLEIVAAGGAVTGQLLGRT